jgi:hypothetical protein
MALARGLTRSSGCAGDEGGDHVGGVPVKRLAASVVAHGGPGVGVGGGILDISKCHPGVKTQR